MVKCSNSQVTDYYLEQVGEAFSRTGHMVKYVQSLHGAFSESKENIMVAANIVDAIKAYMRGYRKLVVWFQGVEPEESYMRHKSMVRYIILSRMEKFVLRRALFRIFVSEAMRRHYERKYGLDIPERTCFCMPCLNTEIHEEAFAKEGKYQGNTFVYVGSLAVWQKFEQTVECYKDVEDTGVPGAKFIVFTKEQEKAKQVLTKYKVRNYEVKYVPNSELPKHLSSAKYGFIIRDDSIVNRVATPTKISTYLSCGVIPIYSTVLEDFHHVAGQMKYVIPYSERLVESINRLSASGINHMDVLKEYKEVFDRYYNIKKYVAGLTSKLRSAGLV